MGGQIISMFSNVQKMYLISFFQSLIFFGAIIVPFFLEWGGLSYTGMFVLESWYMLWIFVMEVPTGVFADRYGRKTSLILSGLLVAIGALLFVSKPDFYVFMLADFVWAAGTAFSTGAQTAIVYDTLKEEGRTNKAKYIFSNCQIAATLGIIVSMPAGSIIAGMALMPYPDNLALPTALTAIPMVISAFLAITLKEPKRKRTMGNVFALASKGIRYLATHKVLRVLALDYVLISGAAFMMFWLYQPLLKISNVDISLWGIVAAAFNAFAILLVSNIRRLEKAFGSRRLLFISALVPGILYIVLGLYQNLWLILASVFLVNGLGQIREPLFEHYMNYYIKSKDRATVLSAISMLGRVVLILLYPLVGFLMDTSINYALISLGVLTIIFALTSKVDEKMLR